MASINGTFWPTLQNEEGITMGTKLAEVTFHIDEETTHAERESFRDILFNLFWAGKFINVSRLHEQALSHDSIWELCYFASRIIWLWLLFLVKLTF